MTTFLYYKGMVKTFMVFMSLAFLTGCFGAKKQTAASQDEAIELPSRSGDSAQAFSLPGVPLKFMPPAPKAKAPAPSKSAEAEQPATEAAAPAPEKETAAARPAENGDLEYHLSAAKKYALKKKYKSAAAEYGAAVPFVPAGDARAVLVLERQGAMLLRSGSEPKAKEAFLAAIQKAKELKAAGNDLSNAHLGLGYCLEKAKDIPEALKNYEKAKEFATGKKAKDRIAKTIADLKAAK
jgi:tetratricopeptide (TPR) repeat protein